MREVYTFIQKVARTSSNVLILGQSGTGKGLVARAIHFLDGSALSGLHSQPLMETATAGISLSCRSIAPL